MATSKSHASPSRSHVHRNKAAEPRTIDPDVAKDARHSGVPDVSFYDTSAIDRTGPSNWYALAGVLIVVLVLLGVLYAFY